MSCPRLKGVRCVRAKGYPENKPKPKTGEGVWGGGGASSRQWIQQWIKLDEMRLDQQVSV